jgi:hypothetical protein
MLLTIGISLIIVALALMLLGVNILLSKDGKFPETHIGKNKAMTERGIHCVATQDREARKSINTSR